MGIWHLTFASEGRLRAFTNEPAVLAGVRALRRGAGATLVLFCLVDEHVHVVVSAEQAGRTAGSVQRSLNRVAEVSIGPAFVREVKSRRHLEWLADRYIVAQPEKHGLGVHAALWPGSCFLDLAGARQLQGPALLISTLLPRYRLRSAFRTVGLSEEPLVGLTDDELRRVGAVRIVTAAEAAAGITTLGGRSAPASAARRAVAGLCAAAGIASRDLAFALGIRVTSARRLQCASHDPELGLATRRRLELENRVIRGLGTPNSGSDTM